MNLAATRIAQIGLGAGTLLGGYHVGTAVSEQRFMKDWAGDPSRPVATDGSVVVYAPNAPQGKRTAVLLTGAGALTAGAGAALAMVTPPASKPLAALAAIGGAALFAAGTGVIVGAGTTMAKYENTDMYPLR